MFSRRNISILAPLAAIASVVYGASPGEFAVPQLPNGADHAKPDTALPNAFKSVLAEIKAKTRVPVLLPSRLPEPVGKAEHAVIQKAGANAYAISLYYELGVGDSGLAAYFSGDANPGYSPEDLGNVSEVKLARDFKGFFRPISCGGSCAPANLWWIDGQILYQIQLRLPSSLDDEADERKTITEVANSAILAGPR